MSAGKLGAKMRGSMSKEREDRIPRRPGEAVEKKGIYPDRTSPSAAIRLKKKTDQKIYKGTPKGYAILSRVERVERVAGLRLLQETMASLWRK